MAALAARVVGPGTGPDGRVRARTCQSKFSVSTRKRAARFHIASGYRAGDVQMLDRSGPRPNVSQSVNGHGARGSSVGGRVLGHSAEVVIAGKP